MDKLKKLEEIVNVLNNSVTPEEFSELLVVVANAIKGMNAKLESDLIQIQQELDAFTDDSIREIKAEGSKSKSEIDTKLHSSLTQFNALVKEVRGEIKNLVKKIKMPKDGEPGKDSDEEVVAQKVESKLEKNLPKLGRGIRDSLELLQDDERLDSSAIKGMDKMQEGIEKRALGILDQRTQFLINKQTPKTSWGSITGTLSNQTDLQDALNLKYDSADFNTDWDTRLATKSTTDLAEGTNLYFTDQRAIDAVDLSPYAIDEDVKKYSGFENRTDSTMSMSGSTFTISGDYNIWINSIGKVNITTPLSVEVTADQQLSYIYFDWYDGAVRLNVSTTAWDFREGYIVPTALVFKDDVTYALSDERHGYNRDLEWHYWAHQNIGAMYYDGLTGEFTADSLSVIQGTIFDEDIEFNTGGTKTTTSLWYRGEPGEPLKMRIVRNSTRPYSYIGDNIQWDNGSGTLQEVGNNNYYVSWVYATNDPAEPIYTVIGQGNHTNLNNARGEAQPIINLTTAEWKLLYKVIFRNTSPNITYVEAQDFRTVQTGVPTQSVSPTSHSILSDRDAINSHPISAITDLQGELDGLVPYTGADQDVDLGAQTITSEQNITTADTLVAYTGTFVDTVTVGTRVKTFNNDGSKYTSIEDDNYVWTLNYDIDGRFTGRTVTSK